LALSICCYFVSKEKTKNKKERMIVTLQQIPIHNIIIKTTTMSLFENPLGRMYGPFFLILYALICLGAILYVRYLLPKRMLRTADEDNPKIPDKPDPYEIAYLWQTENELLSLVIFNLVRRGFLSLKQGKTQTTIRKNEKDATHLSAMEKDVYMRFEKETSLETFAKDVYCDSHFRTHAESMDKHLKEQGLLWSYFEAEDFRVRKMKIVLALVAVALYKIAAALSHGHQNIGLLIIMCIIASAILMKVEIKKMPSAKGYKLLEQMKQLFRPLHGEQLMKQPFYTEQLLLGVYGFSLLAGTDYSGFYDAAVSGLKIQPSVEFTGDSSGCSSSGCSGGSGCGGGCGGCGGCS
jgi:uncharacterized protein (TIGR04222 family)